MLQVSVSNTKILFHYLRLILGWGGGILSEAGSCYIALAAPKLTIYTRLASDLWLSLCLCIPSAEIYSPAHNYAWQYFSFLLTCEMLFEVTELEVEEIAQFVQC